MKKKIIALFCGAVVSLFASEEGSIVSKEPRVESPFEMVTHQVTGRSIEEKKEKRREIFSELDSIATDLKKFKEDIDTKIEELRESPSCNPCKKGCELLIWGTNFCYTQAAIGCTLLLSKIINKKEEIKKES